MAKTELRRVKVDRFVAGDPLRGLTALCIVVFHAAYNILYREEGPQGSFERVFGPTTGAALRSLELVLNVFFVLSAYLIARPFVAAYVEGRRSPNVRRYARNRLLRIVPTFWGIYTIVLLVRGTEGQGLGDILPLYLFGGLVDNRALSPSMGQSWTLSMELAFYLTIPLAIAAAGVFAGPRARRVRVLLAACFLLWIGSALLRTAVPPTLFWLRLFPCLLYGFMPGVALAALEMRVPRGGYPRWMPAALVAGGVGLLAAARSIAPELYMAQLPDRILAVEVCSSLGTGLIVAGPLMLQWNGQKVWRVLHWRPLHWVGERSYSLFLVHQAVIGAWLASVDFGDGRAAALKLSACALAVSLPAAWLAHRLFERPSMALMGRRATTASTAPVPQPTGR